MTVALVLLGIGAAAFYGFRLVRASMNALSGERVQFVSEPIAGRIKKPRKGERL